MLLTTENIILIGALLLLVSVFAGKVAYRFGAPALLLFLGVGMLFGLRLISFNSAPVAQFVGMVALCIILFSGGMDTRYRAIRPVIGPGVVLATVGVALTALIACGIIPYREQISVEEVTKNLGSGLYLSTQVIHIPRGSGLGTSSILAGACVKAIYRMLGKALSQEELYNRVLCMEQIMSTGGGWQDQVGGLAPGIKMVTSDAAIVQEIGCSPCSISTETLQELNERFCLIYSGQRRLARNLLRDIVSRYVSGNPDTVEVLYEIQRIAVLMRFELEKGNVDGFAQLLNQHWELSRRLDGGCTNTCIDMIFSSVEDLIDGKMICGAGGGGFLQVILKKGVTAEQVQKRLREVFQDSGVEVWRCSLVG